VSLAATIQGSFLRLHQLLYERTDGRVGHRTIGVPTLLLRTTGRRTGAQRTNALVYAKDGEEYVVVASNGGQDNSPGWFFNVSAKPEVEIQVGQAKMAGTARVLEPKDQDYERLWRLVNANNRDRYNGYQSKTIRPIPLIVVSPGEPRPAAG
jgi:deazaflavin-dependent oxidoreductase (nitroreductase family)